MGITVIRLWRDLTWWQHALGETDATVENLIELVELPPGHCQMGKPYRQINSCSR
jgi:hypothetical protein